MQKTTESLDSEKFSLEERPEKITDKDKVIANLFDVIEGLKNENEKLHRKLAYTENLLKNLKDIEDSKEIAHLKEYATNNLKVFHQMLEEIFQFRKQIEIEKLVNEDSKSKYDDLRNKYESIMKDIEIGTNKDTMVLQIKSLENTVEQLSKEVDELSGKNSHYLGILKQKDFFREYDLLCKEVNGLREYCRKLSEQLKEARQERDKLKEITS